MIPVCLMLFFVPDVRTHDLIDQIAASGRIVEIAIPVSERLSPRAQVAPGVTQQAAEYPAHETADALRTGLARFLLAQAFLATQVERGVGALLVSVAIEVLDDFRSDGRIGNAAVETDPQSLFFERDRGAVGACNTHTWQMEHGVLQ